MGDFKRATRELSLQEIPAPAMQALQTHIEIHNLGDVLGDALICIEERSEKTKKGLFSLPGLKSSTSYVILTKGWLFESIAAEGESFAAISARLADVVVSDYKQSPFYSKMPDNGAEVTGSFTGALERGSKFIGLGEDDAGNKFKAMLIAAVMEAKR